VTGVEIISHCLVIVLHCVIKIRRKFTST